MRVAFRVPGQCLSGKNHVQMTRTGRRYPLARWAAWRDEIVRHVQAVMAAHGGPFPVTAPCRCLLIFTHADRRRRDIPGLMDALYHVFERAGLIADDSLFVEGSQTTGVHIDPLHAGVEVLIETLSNGL